MTLTAELNKIRPDIFQSFWMGGFECADHLNAWGNRVDFLELTDHLRQLDEDYERLKTVNISTVREGIRWSQVETAPYQYDFSIIGQLLDAGERHSVQQIWDICHFGYPADLTPLHPHFTSRFVSLCVAFANYCLPRYKEQPLIVTPFNEVSFLSWLGGEVGGTSPYCLKNGWEVKYAIMRAYIQGVAALKQLSSDILIMTTEPLVNVVPPLFASHEEVLEAKEAHELQFQAMDMLCGRICPELGGKPEYMDILGYNYYYNNQWVTGFQVNLPWLNESSDDRWRSLSDLMKEAYRRYEKPVALTETSHPGEDRPLWIEFVGREVLEIINAEIPFLGVCLYPIIDRPDWDQPDLWHHSGLWDNTNREGRPNRAVNEDYLESLILAQNLLKTHGKINAISHRRAKLNEWQT